MADKLSNSLSEAIANMFVAPNWSNPTECCTTHDVAFSAPSNGFIVVAKTINVGVQLRVNNVIVYYTAPSYFGTSSARLSWCIPVLKGDSVKLLSDSGTLPSGMSATFYPARHSS